MKILRMKRLTFSLVRCYNLEQSYNSATGKLSIPLGCYHALVLGAPVEANSASK